MGHRRFGTNSSGRKPCPGSRQNHDSAVSCGASRVEVVTELCCYVCVNGFMFLIDIGVWWRPALIGGYSGNLDTRPEPPWRFSCHHGRKSINNLGKEKGFERRRGSILVFH